MAVLNAQHLLAVIVVAPAFAPELRRLERRHQHLDGTGAVLLLAHDATDLPQNPQAERQGGIDAGGFPPAASGDGRRFPPPLEFRAGLAGNIETAACTFLRYWEIQEASSGGEPRKKHISSGRTRCPEAARLISQPGNRP